MPKNWKTYKLSELGTIVTGKTPSSKNPEHFGLKTPFVTPTDFSYFVKNVYQTVRSLSDAGVAGLSKKLLPSNSVLVTCIGSQMGKVAINRVPVVTNQQLNSIIPNELTDADFLYYLISYNNDQLRTMAGSGSTMPLLNKTDFENIEFTVPELKEQKAIASILSALDDKIELNLQMNKTLEEMAMALYKHWFVDFGPFQGGNFIESELGSIPEGWEIKEFQSLYELRKGLSYKSKFYSDDGLPMINLKCFDRKGGFRQDGIKFYAGEFKNTHEVEPGDLMIAMTDLTQDRAVLGSPILCPEIQTKSKVIASLDIGILKQKALKEINLNLFFNYTMRTNRYHEYILGYGNGSTVMHLDKKGVLEYQALLPPKNVLKEFEDVVSSFREMESSNLFEIQSLTTLRDTLLPKLISGEVRVKEAVQTVANAL